MGCWTSIETGNVGLKERMGKFEEELDPGCHMINCCMDKVHNVSLKLQQLGLMCESKTKDNVFVKIGISIHYKVVAKKVKESYYQLENPAQQIKAYVFDVVRAQVPKKTLDEIFVVKEELAFAVKESLGATMSKYGFEIIATPITDISPDTEVKDALNQKQVEYNLRAGKEERALADKMVQICNAEAHAEKIRIQAVAEADAKYHAGEGLSRQRQAIINGLADSMRHFQQANHEVNAKEVMDLIMLTQYFDMMQHIGTSKTGTNTIFIPHAPSSVKDISAQLRQGFLESDAAKRLSSFQ